MSAEHQSTVESLRAWAPMVAAGYTVPAASTAMLVAADEIERLRKALCEIAATADGAARWLAEDAINDR